MFWSKIILKKKFAYKTENNGEYIRTSNIGFSLNNIYGDENNLITKENT